jgi:hypothetical protein
MESAPASLKWVFANEENAPRFFLPSSFCTCPPQPWRRRVHPSDFPRPLPGRTETFAFLFDMNQLFEEFIAELVRRSLPFSEGGFIRRELREVWQSRGWMFHAQSGTRHLLCDETGNNRFKLVPDIRFETGTGKCMCSERIWFSLS